MLTEIRDRATGWIAWVIVILITIPFALWGIQSYFEGGNEVPIATVNDAEISNYEYQDALSRQRQMLSQRLGRGFDPALLDSLGIKRQVIDSLVDQQLMQAYAADSNFRLSDAQLSSLITSNEAFSDEGNFSETRYIQILGANNFTPQTFEASQRQQAVLDQLQNGLIDSAFVGDEEFNRLLSLETQTRESEYVLISGEKYASEFDISDEEVSQYYDDNLDTYQTEERTKISYIELSVDLLAQSIEPTEDELKVTYDQLSGRFVKPESRRASHILFNVPSSATDEEKAGIEKAAQLVLSQALDGEDFAKLAEIYSDDPGSGNKGGDLGVVTKGQMVKPFEDAVFSMEEGDIEGLIESTFGFHIIKLTELKKVEQQTLEEVRDEIVAETKRQQAENLFAELGESFQNLVFEDPENITTAADELDLPILETDWFTKDQGEGVAGEPQVRRAAFSEDVINEGLVSPAIELGFDRLVAVQKKEHEPARPIPLEELREDIVTALSADKSKEKAKKLGEEFVASMSASATESDWNAFVQEQGLDLIPLSSRRGEIEPALFGLGNAVFSHRAPQAGGIGIGGVALSNGDYAIYAVKSVALGNVDEVDEGIKARLRQVLLERDGNSYYRQFSKLLRENSEIVIAEDQL